MPSRGVPMPESDRESIRIRKIDNGFIVSRDGMDKKGNWKQSETFSPTKPVVQIATEPKAKPTARKNGLLDAMKVTKK
jgi:hypothetical protein